MMGPVIIEILQVKKYRFYQELLPLLIHMTLCQMTGYTKKLSPDVVYKEIARLSGRHFDYTISERF